MTKINAVISGHDFALCEDVRRMLSEQPDIEATCRVNAVEQNDPLLNLMPSTDVLIVVLNSDWEQVLQSLASRPVSQRPPTIVVGHPADPHVMRRAMQAGVRDYFAPPVAPVELLRAVRTIGQEKGISNAGAHSGSMTAVINAKGGSGGSVISVNLAHIMATHSREPLALLDLDLQFGMLPLALDLEPRNSLLTALSAKEHLDSTALDAYMTKHASGVHVLSAMSDQMPLPWEISTDSLTRLLALMRQSYPRVIVDLPRQIDPLTSTVLAQADKVLVVMEESIAHVRDAIRMLRVITTGIGVPRDKVILVVNRHSDAEAITLKDIMKVISPPSHFTLPSDFRLVSQSLNNGIPLLNCARNAPLTKALQDLAEVLLVNNSPSAHSEAPPPPPKPSRLRSVLTSTLRR